MMSARDYTDTSRFDFQPRTRVVFGPGSLERLPDVARELRATRVLLVTDPGIIKAGHVDPALHLLKGAGLATTLFSQVIENPTTSCVDRCVEVARSAAVDLLVGLGGGSSIDTAKGCNFILTNGGRMSDYWGYGKASRPMLPLIAIPTTGGTGSECQSYALISDPNTHAKMACGDPKAAARAAILDPKLTVSQPVRVTACTGIDALTHSLETAVTRRRSPVSSLYSREAFRLLNTGFPRVLANPTDVEARGMMLLGAAWAGTAIENSMLGAAHSAANPLTACLGIVHGQAVGLMLPHVIMFNGQDPEVASVYRDYLQSIGVRAPHGAEAQVLADLLRNHLRSAGLLSPLRSLGLAMDGIPELSKQAAGQWTAQFNPRQVGDQEFAAFYTAAL